jgi:hypothetical protein
MAARSPALLAALPQSAAGAACALPPAAAASGAAAAEVAALRRWIHTGGLHTAWQQQLREQQQQQWLLRGPAAELQQLQCLRRFSSRPRGRQDLQASTIKTITDQGWYIVSESRRPVCGV